MPRKKKTTIPSTSLPNGIDYSKTELVELTSLPQLKRGVRYRAYYAPDWKEAVRYAVLDGREQPAKVYKWQNICYVEVNDGR